MKNELLMELEAIAKRLKEIAVTDEIVPNNIDEEEEADELNTRLLDVADDINWIVNYARI
jgi:hypothetical protein